jgi:hypothetical protein
MHCADQLHMIDSKLVMLGDETWIKLFPTLFYRQDGVSSFDVSLYVSHFLDGRHFGPALY